MYVCMAWYSPNSITPTITKTFPLGKSWTQTVTNHETIKFRWKSPTLITKVADANHLNMSRCLRQNPWQVRDKLVCVAMMEFSLLQCTGKDGDKVRNKSADLVADTNHESPRRDLCHGLSWFVCDKSTTLSRACPGLCCKVGVMEFGLMLGFMVIIRGNGLGLQWCSQKFQLGALSPFPSLPFSLYWGWGEVGLHSDSIKWER